VAYWPSTLRSRLTLWYTALLGVPLITLAIGCYFLFARTLHSRTDQFISDALAAFSRELLAERRAGLETRTAMRSTVNEVRFQNLHIAILDSAGDVVAMTPIAENVTRVDRRPPKADRAWITDNLRDRDLRTARAFTIGSGRDAYRVDARPLEFEGRRFALTGTYPLRDIDDALRQIRGIFVVVMPLLLVVAATGGYFLAMRSLAPVSAMAARAAEISAANLQDRLPVAGDEELAGLARVVNDLLDRLEASFAQQRRFMADASHELRTPTAILRTEADVTLGQAHRTEREYRASVEIMRESARRLTRIVDDLFLLARADAGVLVERRDTVYLEEILHEATRGVRPLANQRAISVKLRDVVEAPMQGDADLLGRLLMNLLDNAIKHSPDGGAVDVDLARTNGWYEIRVRDAGGGIPPEAQSRVFERFFRVDDSRAQGDHGSTSGAGLGLAIARRIAEVHGGKLDLVESRPGRTVFRVTLPRLANETGGK
jgi:heavy metal sensor kinase